MTIGQQDYQSIVNKWPILGQLIPDSMVRDIDTARMMMQFASQAEQAALRAANRAIAAHNAGLMTTSDYANYDAYRHKIYDTQVLWLRSLRQALYNVPGGSIYANRLPWPNWLKPLRPETPRNQTPMRLATDGSQGTAGLGIVGIDDWIGVATIAVLAIAATVIAGLVITNLSAGFQQWILVRGQTSVIESAIDARRSAFEACVAGGGSATDCAQQVAHAVPAPSQAAIDNFIQQSSGDKGFVWYMGILAISLLAGGTVWYGWREGWFNQKG